MIENPLGKEVIYKTKYDASLLFPVPRNIGREKIGLKDEVPFTGYDIWNCYELSWLNQKGKPHVAILVVYIPHSSENIVESKSLKLYLNSFNNTKFSNKEEVARIIEKDLSNLVNSSEKILLEIKDLNNANHTLLRGFNAFNIDHIDVEISNNKQSNDLLKIESDDIVEESLCSDLLRSNCLITKQPDWGSLLIIYKGKKINHESLLKYIISFRDHIEFHEQCVERIFNDLYNLLKPIKLYVEARYTRRGGIDINPVRASWNLQAHDINNERLIRQ